MWCEGAQAFGRAVTIKLKYADLRQITRSRSYPAPIAAQAELRAASLDLIRSILPTQAGVRLVGVTVSNFREVAEGPALPLWAGAACEAPR